jgi:hypothetical protein
MHKRIALAILLAVSARIACAQPYKRLPEATPSQPLASDTQLLWNGYARAVYDSTIYVRYNVRPLRPLVADKDGIVRVVMLTWRDGKPGDTLTAGPLGLWVTGVPEVQTICRGFKGDIEMQLRQLLGLPPDAETDRFLVLTVKASDLFRPSPDETITTIFPCSDPSATDCGNAFPSTTTPAHYQWMATEVFYLHSVPGGYPWTHLGYTYNWAPNADRYGASEYVIRGGAKATIVENVTPEKYCAPAP